MRNLIIVIALCSFSFGFAQENGQIKGVVTYFFNDNFGSKPDVGTKILIHKKEVSDTLHDILKKHRTNEVIYLTYVELLKSMKTKDLMDKFNKAETNYKTTRLLADKYVSETEAEGSTLKLTVDGAGNYSYDLPIGYYEIIAVSKNSRSRIMNTKLNIEKNETKIVDFDFDRT